MNTLELNIYNGATAFVEKYTNQDSDFADMFFIPMAENGLGSIFYLYPDGAVRIGCVDKEINGFYATKEIAQRVLDNYKKDK